MAMTHAWHDIVHDLQDEIHDLATINKLDAARQAYLALWATFIAVPLLFGIDRFATFMNPSWDPYVAAWANNILHGNAGYAVAVFGVVELVLAAAVAVLPRIGGDLLALWLVLMAANMYAIGDYGWAATGTIGLAICCLAMARMSTHYHHKES